MNRGFFHELRLARHRFTVLATLLLVLPLLFSLAPRPSQATADYIAGLTGYSLCSPLSDDTQSGKQVPQSPCQDCLNGAHCPACATIVQQVIAVLNPPRVVSGALRLAAKPLQTQVIAAIYAARGPPAYI